MRFALVGDIPLPEDLRRFHLDTVGEGLRTMGVSLAALIERDVLRAAREAFDTWPLQD
ncbi:hypothetical protein [Microbispora rosea]|uniref:hypothetical protein n=1 Tax=Microbispora rosea TaxID=58117 RepID=UPI0013566721|nr:hypothetical protein [Microbispora rosea]